MVLSGDTTLNANVIKQGTGADLIVHNVIAFSDRLSKMPEMKGVLAKLTGCARPGTVLLIMTANAHSLSHALFGPDWEGYFDWTHFGVDRITVKSLREELPRLGWRVSELTTRLLWDADADPTRATLRQWWAADARFRRLLVKRELGDFITCVAVLE